MGSFWQDLRHAYRALGKSPWFAAVAVITLALGIAVNTSIFSIINGFLLRPMPVSHPEQLVVLSLQQAGDKALQNFSYPDYLDLRDQSSSFSDIFAYRITLAGLTADNQALQGLNGFLSFRLGAQFTGAMGLLGLILAVVGVYSVASYAAVQRTQEIGIRMAIGATPRDILKMVLRQGIGMVATGLLAGLAAAFAGTRLLADLFYGVAPGDPATFASVATLLLAVALLACWIPARRATRVSPMIALRFE
jgi:ABC-type antimicrobial peptide transport system permease subunit